MKNDSNRNSNAYDLHSAVLPFKPSKKSEIKDNLPEKVSEEI